jgi:hypothetical protein
VAILGFDLGLVFKHGNVLLLSDLGKSMSDLAKTSIKQCLSVSGFNNSPSAVISVSGKSKSNLYLKL